MRSSGHVESRPILCRDEPRCSVLRGHGSWRGACGVSSLNRHAEPLDLRDLSLLLPVGTSIEVRRIHARMEMVCLNMYLHIILIGSVSPPWLPPRRHIEVHPRSLPSASAGTVAPGAPAT